MATLEQRSGDFSDLSTAQVQLTSADLAAMLRRAETNCDAEGAHGELARDVLRLIEINELLEMEVVRLQQIVDGASPE
jgi:hypothetical protein